MHGKGLQSGSSDQLPKLIADSRETVQRAEELLQQSTTDTFLGRDTQQLSAEDAKRTE